MDRQRTTDTNKALVQSKQFMLALYDVIVIYAAALLALFLVADLNLDNISAPLVGRLLGCQVLNCVLALVVLGAFRSYSILWECAGIRELLHLCVVMAFYTALSDLWMCLLDMQQNAGYYAAYFLVATPLVAAGRYREQISEALSGGHKTTDEIKETATLLFGAGEAGRSILKEIQVSSHAAKKVLCILDDDKEKWNTWMMGVPIVGGREMLGVCVKRYRIQEILVAIPSLMNERRGELIEACQRTGCRVSVLPGLYQLINRELHVTTFRDVRPEDLLGREPIRTDIADIMAYVSGKTVLVTGGGGSIGSEICRQIARYLPNRLIILDEYENGAYDLQMELCRRYPHLRQQVLIADIRDRERIHRIFQKYRPQIIYHAAAHKHVPLMEAAPGEAIKNNVFGTRVIAEEAGLCGVERFVMISSDKAVRPTNIMGASKRICEMIIQTCNKRFATEYVAVRFGNVLGSNGSVVPLFQKQIEEGGPVTVTHPDIIRYFMTIPEAVSLVLQAGAYAHGGEIFILNMGDPVKIVDMAKKLIRLYGYVPDVDIRIEYTGLRPGEKLYEELLMDEEKTETNHPRIFVGKALDVDGDFLDEMLGKLKQAADGDPETIRRLVKELVPDYHSPEY